MTVIKVENLGKRYIIDHQKRQSRYQYETFGGALANCGKRACHFLRHPLSSFNNAVEHEEFWALKDINFEINQGDRVGIIGRNGAGKSTLLKILSRITSPTTGQVRIKGRVSSLLEVGTGFHPELTGRENIYLNGAILGMKRQEIKAKFDEIVAFAEVEKFLDTPVKHYSSGMYVRLAFAVAAHLEPEILIVDEVLAVGDAQFQKKCLGKMNEVSKMGRTVIFVSHDLNTIEAMCSRLILLDKGVLFENTTNVRSAITSYLNGVSNRQGVVSLWKNNGNEYNHPVMQPIFFAVVDEDELPLLDPVPNDKQLYVIIKMLIKQNDPSLSVGISLYNSGSELLLWSISTDRPEKEWPSLEVGVIGLRCALPKRFLNEGIYRIEINAGLHCREYILKPTQNSPAVNFEIRGGLSDSPYWLWARPGILAPEWKWERIS